MERSRLRLPTRNLAGSDMDPSVQLQSPLQRFALIVLLALMTCGQLRAQDNVAQPKAYSAQELDELKKSGWKRSKYYDSAEQALNQLAIADTPLPKLDEFREVIGPILQSACVDCHGESEQEGNVRIDTLDPNLHAGKDVDWWTEVYAVVSKGEMPPADSGELSEADRKKIVEWLSTELQTASIVRRQSTSHSTFRRMTRYETNYALQDLLGLPWNFANDLPPDAHSDESFQNSSELLHMSVSQFETYHRLARTAISRAIVKGEQPKTLHWGITMKDASRLEWRKQDQQIAKAKKEFESEPEKLKEELAKLEERFRKEHSRSYYRDLSNGKTAPATWDYDGAKHAMSPTSDPVAVTDSVDHVAILPAGQWINIELGNQIPDEGTLRVRVRASKTKSDQERSPSLQLYFGWQASNEGRALIRVSQTDTPVTAEPGACEFYQWDVPLGEIYPRNSVRTTSSMGALPSPSEYIRLVNSSASPDEVLIDYVQVQSPVYDSWPPPAHERIFHHSNDSQNESQVAREIIARFMAKAWRRPISDEQCAQKLKLFESLRPECVSFEEAIVEVLATVVASPNFLYIVQESAPAQSEVSSASPSPSRAQLTSYELATRLSMFLWCSIPDDELLELASTDRLRDEKVLNAQVERMLTDPRSQRFAEQFVEQWLNMELLEFINFREQVPGFEPLLKEAMQREPIALFEELLKENESVLNFVHADYAMVNERLAKHYGMAGVYGNHFRRVPLDGNFKRGGLLTQAGLLAMNSDYPDSHPIKRGKWLLVNLLNDPPPPPPPAVPQIDLANPEIAKMTLKERIEDHRNHAACMACHVKIDPWGIAFENFDAIGRWRDEVRGKPIDASSDLFNKQTLDGMGGLKHFLLENRQDQFVAALVSKVTSYALGRPLKFADRADLESITARVRSQGDGLATLLTAVATSELFQSK